MKRVVSERCEDVSEVYCGLVIVNVLMRLTFVDYYFLIERPYHCFESFDFLIVLYCACSDPNASPLL